MEKREQFALVQALRGVAALWVVLYHAREHTPSFGFLFGSGHYGVAIFFALSGFVIAHSISDRGVTLGFAGRFMFRRSIRLDPAYWASIALVIALALLSAKVKGDAYSLPSGASLAAHSLYIQELLRIPEINSVYWTLTYEVQFYAFFVLSLALVPPRLAMPIMFALAAVAAMQFFASAPHGLFLDLWPCFFAGVLARQKAVVSLGVLAFLMAFKDTFAAVAALTAIGLAVACQMGVATTGLAQRPWQALGAISYSLYLTHNPIIGAAAFVSHKMFGTGPIAQVLTLIIVVAASVTFAALFWVVIERPTHKLSRRVSLSAWRAKPTSRAFAGLGGHQ